MKKLIVIIVTAVLVWSCTEECIDPNPAKSLIKDTKPDTVRIKL
jgi:hypothetical protein